MNTDDYDGHTPGPWEILELPVTDPQWYVKLSAPEVGEFASIQGTWKWQPNKAELALIAAAPDLLADNKRLQRLLWKHDICDYCEIEAHDCSCYWCESCDSRADSFHDISGDFIICCKCYEACEYKEMK